MPWKEPTVAQVGNVHGKRTKKRKPPEAAKKTKKVEVNN